MSRHGERRKRPPSQEVEQGGAPGWMVTYGDLMSLLLTFFVLLVSFSSIQLSEFQKAMGSLKGALGVLPENDSVLKLHSLARPDPLFMHTPDMESDIVAMKEFINSNGMEGSVEVEKTPLGILVRVRDPILFELGKADLKPSSYGFLQKLGALAKKYSRELRISGHTDDLPIHTPEFASNWELSAARAVNVLHFLADRSGIEEGRMSCQAFAEYRPVVPNTSAENRMQNRRVELLIIKNTPDGDATRLNVPRKLRSRERFDISRYFDFTKP